MLSKKDKFIVEELVKTLLPHTRKNSKSWEMLITVDNHAFTKDWPARKLNRWIGYAQCLIVAEGGLTLDEVIEKTRAIEKIAQEKYGDA